MNLRNTQIKPCWVVLTLCFSLLSGCADWNSVPAVVDDDFGYSVNHMVKNQTLNPEAGLTHEPVLSYDGQKGQGVIRSYRAPTVDLKKGKQELDLDID